MRAGRGEFLAELRIAYPVFVRFGGIDYDEDDDAIAKLDDFVSRSQRIFAAYGGNLLQLTLGDKGAYLYAVFGSPLAHEDDAARAAAAALEVRDLDGQTAASGIQIGIAHGRLRSGTYGHEWRRTFVCLGDAVNLAARLMAKAPADTVYAADAVRQAAGDGFAWQELEPMTVKGKAQPVLVHALQGRRAARRCATCATGCRCSVVARSWRRCSHGSTTPSPAAAPSPRSSPRRGWASRGSSPSTCAPCAGAACSSPSASASRSGRARPTSPGARCGAPSSGWTTRHRRRRSSPASSRSWLRSTLRSWRASRCSQPVVDLAIPDNDLTSSFDAKLRKTSLEALLATCLRARSEAQPIVVVLEDVHYLDELSRDLLVVLARAGADRGVVIVVAHRPLADAGHQLGVESLPHYATVELAELGEEDARRLIDAKLGEILGENVEPPAALIELVTARAEGNPFTIEELLNWIVGHGIDLADEEALHRAELPHSLESLILSRVDRLPEQPRRVLKVASVVGRVFRAPLLPQAYPELGALAVVEERLDELRGADLVSPDVEADRSWLFKHAVTRDVAYESLPFALREQLHESTAVALEAAAQDGAALEQMLDLLAHHWWHSANAERKREALALAHEAADPVMEARAETALAEVARKAGRFDEALQRLDRAGAACAASGDEAGQGRVLHLLGTLAAQQGDLATAREAYLASVAIRERSGDRAALAGLLSNLGVIEEYEGDYAAARAWHQSALDLRNVLGDRWAIGVSQTNLGMIASLEGRHEEARERFLEAIRLNREVGDPWMVAICNNNLGNATRGLGDHDAARAHYAAALRAYRAYDDHWALAFLVEDVGVLAARVGEHARALALLGAADALHEELGAPRPPALEAELTQGLAAARAVLGEAAAGAARAEGRAAGLAAALDGALAFLDG